MNIQNNPQFYLGVVEDRMDPLMLGRARVRVMGLHTHDKTELPTEDLPWAYKIQPTTSGAITGIGHAPVGVMEGTWVIVQYIDPDQQMPFIIGTLGGIPQKVNPPLESFELLNADQGESTMAPAATPAPAPTEAPAPEPKTEEEALQKTEDGLLVKMASEWQVSQAFVDELKRGEGFRANPYDDGVGVITIGYGSTYLADGSKVKMTTPPMTKEQAEALLKYTVDKTYAAAVKSRCRVPLTQSMFDALVDLSYNAGGGGVGQFINESGLNAGKYEQAADYFLNFKVRPGSKVEKGLRNRRAKERATFLKDGIPKPDGSIAETPQSQAAEAASVAASPVGVGQSTAAGVSSAKFQRKNFVGTQGFQDPNGKYPLVTHLQEPDTNRLARHQKIKETIVYFKEAAEHKGVPKANGKGSWDQAKTPYNAMYPFNNVWQSEAGHIQEWDDTPGRERIHTYHKTGTFFEVDHNGTMVRRVVGDDFVLLERNGRVDIIGDCDIHIGGAKTLFIEGTYDVEVNGAATINIHDSAVVNVADDCTVTAGGNMAMNVGGNFGLNVAGNIDIKAGGNLQTTGGGNNTRTAGGAIADDAPSISHNTGVAQPAAPAAPGFTAGVGGGPANLPVLEVQTRADEAAAQYESPDEGTPAQVLEYKQEQIKNGTTTAAEQTKDTPVQEATPAPDNGVPAVINPCGIPEGTTTFNYAEKISASWTLAQLTDGGSRKLKAAQGYRADQIYCHLKHLATNCLDPIKAKWASVQINSGYRDFVPSGGSTKSQHMIGQAADISFPGLTRSQLYDRILEIQKMIPYDQLLLEYASGPGWIHISFNPNGNRKQAFTMDHHTRKSPDLYTIVKLY